MGKLITGLHHVTAISGGAQENLNFYNGILGLRRVKTTVNFENPEVYHLYFGDTAGNPGTVMTTFPYGADLAKGRHGKGMLNTTAFSVDINGLDFWLERLDRFGIAYKHPQERFRGEVVVYLEDYDGLGLELVFNENDRRSGFSDGSIPTEWAIRGFHNIEIWLDDVERSAAFLTSQMEHEIIREGAGRIRLGAANEPGKYVDLISMPGVMKGLGGRGSVHHLAFATPDRDTQIEIRERILNFGLDPSPVRERKYFSSVYFREPGGVLFEIATSGPGFTVDEPLDSLGQTLQLPMVLELQRERLEKILPELIVQTEIS